MPVAVQGVSRRQDDDPLAKIAKGLSIAQSVFGIKSAMEQSDLRDLQQQRIGDQTRQADERLAFDREQATARSGTDASEKTRARKNEYLSEVGTFQTSKRVENLADQTRRARKIGALLKLGTGPADAVVVPQIFRLSGDVGVVREEDFKRIGASPDLMDRFFRAKSEHIEGKRLTPRAREALTDVARLFEADNMIELKRHAETRAKNIAEKFDFVDKDAVLASFDIDGLTTPDPVALRQEIERLAQANLGSQLLSSPGLGFENQAGAEQGDADFINDYLQSGGVNPAPVNQGLQIPGSGVLLPRR